MSKVKIQGNASGTGVVTLTAPNTDTDRTVTLPDGTDTLATTADLPTSIVDNGNATAITIDANERVGLGTGTPSADLEVASSTGNAWTALITNSAATDSNGIKVTTNTTGSGQSIAQFWSGGVQRLKLTGDGRGLSQFTAKAWVNFNGTGTVSIRDSHNVSSITDNGTGTYTINFANNMSNTNYTFNYIANVSNTRMALNRLYDLMTVSSFRVRADEFEGLSTNSTVSRDSSICLAQVFGD